MQRTLKLIDGLSYWSGRAVCILIYGMVASLLYEVISRYLFNAPTNWAHDAATYFFGTYFMCGAAYCLRTKRMISVDLIYGRLSRRTQAIINVCTFIFFLAICYTLIWLGGKDAIASWRVGERSIASTWRPILYPLKMVIPVATFLLLLQGLADFVREASMAFTGKELGAK